MIKLKDILLENTAPSIFTARRTDDRTKRQAVINYRKAVKLVDEYVAGGSKGNLNLSELGLTALPSNLKNVKVSGYFYCDGNKLTSLEGAPSSVGGDFYCNNNKLTSLEGAPSSVGGDFYCNKNKLTSLQGAPSSVGGDFYCYDNELTSLEGAPNSVGGDFYCRYNRVTKFTAQQVKAVCDVTGDIFV